MKSRHYPQIQGFRELNAAKSHLSRPLSRTHTAMTRKLTLFIVTCFSNHERETSSQVSSAATAPCSISLTISIWSLNHLRRSPFSSTLFFWRRLKEKVKLLRVSAFIPILQVLFSIVFWLKLMFWSCIFIWEGVSFFHDFGPNDLWFLCTEIEEDSYV